MLRSGSDNVRGKQGLLSLRFFSFTFVPSLSWQIVVLTLESKARASFLQVVVFDHFKAAYDRLLAELEPAQRSRLTWVRTPCPSFLLLPPGFPHVCPSLS
jgi:hypothetical protein